MKMLPGMTVINRLQPNKSSYISAADHHGPAYLRFGRPVVPNFMPADAFRNRKAIMK
jgi:transketolase